MKDSKYPAKHSPVVLVDLCPLQPAVLEIQMDSASLHPFHPSPPILLVTQILPLYPVVMTMGTVSPIWVAVLEEVL